MKVDGTVRRETLYIAACAIIFSLLLEAVFLIVGKWNYKVLTGNLLGASSAVLNFFIMGLTVQKAVCGSGEQAPKLLKVSQGLRNLFLFIIAALGVILPFFNTAAVLIPLFFPRIAILFRPLFMNRKGQ